MKICIISPKNFPVPAIKGGAVETLITDLLDQNEIKQEFNADIISVFDKENEEEINKYKYSNFILINFEKNFILKRLKFLSTFLKNKFLISCVNKLNCDIRKYIYNRTIVKNIRCNVYDFIITEGGILDDYDKIYKYIEKEKSILHIHGHVLGTEKLEKNFKYFLCISEFITNELTKSNIISKERTRLLYNGVRIENFDKTLDEIEKQAERKKYGIKENEKIIVFCGRTVEDKGVRELILAYKKIYKECNAKLIIVGNSNFANQVVTEYDRELKSISEDIKSNIIFTGHVYNKDLYKIYNIADIAVFPHLWEESFGLVFVEAMASGVPLLVTKSGAVPEIVTNDCGIVLEKGDKEKLINELAENMKKLLNDSELRKAMGKAGKDRAKKFSTQKYYDNFVKILKQLK